MQVTKWVVGWARRIQSVFGRLAVGLMLGGCGSAEPGPAGVVRIAVVGLAPENAVALLVGQMATLNVKAYDERGRELALPPITFSSDRNDTAVVDGKGTVTAAGIGNAKISVRAPSTGAGLFDSALVTVLQFAGR